MIKSIIKRVIVGVSIALILGAIGSCEVKALSKQMKYTNASWYSGTTMIASQVSSVTWNGVPYWQVNTTTSVQVPQAQIVLTSVQPNDGTSNIFADYDRFAFVVYSNPWQATGAILTAFDIPCGAVALTNTNIVNGMNDNYTVIECDISNITSLSSTQIDILFSQRSTSDHVTGARIQSDFYFYKDSILTKLQLIANNIDTTNTNLGTIITKLTDANSTLSLILNRLITIQSKLESGVINITNAQNNTTQSVNDMNDTLKDDDTSNVDTDAISSAKNNVASNNVISNLVLLPVNLFTKILNSTSASCSPFSLGTLFEEELILPCIVLSDYLGSSLVNVIDVLISGLFIYHISRKMVKVFEELSSLRSGGNDV